MAMKSLVWIWFFLALSSSVDFFAKLITEGNFDSSHLSKALMAILIAILMWDRKQTKEERECMN